MLYYLENTDLIECRTYDHAWYKPRTSKWRTFIAHRKIRYFPITPKLQRLFIFLKTSEHIIWHHSHDAVTELWCTFLIMKPINILIVCILSFYWNHRTYVFGYIQISSIYLGHLLHHILVGRWYSYLTTCHWECV